jgi:16S rRNA (guanine966-N2)-methyltransferase
MRIVGGRLKGKKLAVPADEAIRPTSDRVREAVFNILAHGIAEFEMDGSDVLDLFAGTGALGIEALSRGSRTCVMVETAIDARALIRENIEALGLSGVARIFKRDATDLGPVQRLGPFDLVFLDPPYAQGLGEQALISARDGGWLKPGTIAVWEERSDVRLDLPITGFEPIDHRVWGSTQVQFLRYRPG